MKWTDWVEKNRQKLTIRNYEDETLSHVSFNAGYKAAIEKAADWIEEYLGKDNRIDDWLRDSKVLKNGREEFFKDMEE